MKLMLVAFSLCNYVTLADAYGIITLSELDTVSKSVSELK